MSGIRVLLADDHALVRSGIRLVLQTFAGVQVVAEAENGRTALDLVEKLHPDVALLDISMPELNGMDTAARIRSRYPQTLVVILSVHAGEEYVTQALRAGASGYLLKDATPAEFEFALRAVARGETYLSPRVSGAVVEKYLRSGESAVGPLEALTQRQREILQLIAEGKSTKEIAARLDVSIKTVETHRALLMERLGIRDIAGLVRFAVRTGLVDGDR
ncbi:MAG: DNA-binding response regulator [Gammaproteobacteria bacterium RIFCSPLOWO2_02_FULL_61_13]|nr:MAG: DNA-binding response regulator [Gammaproteobacteria bacterium RIFCSPLOWO2_02_FULL_61_13]